MDLRNVKKIKIGNAELKTLGINGKVAWQGLPEFKVDDTLYNPDTFPFFLTIENNANVVFTNFDSSSYKLTVFLIGGGGAGSQGWVDTNAHVNMGSMFEFLQSGAGGGGGEIKTVTPIIVENTTYPISIGNGGTIGTATLGTGMGGYHQYFNTTASTDGGSTSAFGSTANGGKAGQANKSGDSRTDFYNPQGGSSYAKGGNGVQKLNKNQDKPMPTVGATGTTINGVVYGSAGSGGGYKYDYGIEYAGGLYNWYTVQTDTVDADGHGNYGSGGNGAKPRSSQANGVAAAAEILTQPENGFKGAVILKIEEI